MQPSSRIRSVASLLVLKEIFDGRGGGAGGGWWGLGVGGGIDGRESHHVAPARLCQHLEDSEKGGADIVKVDPARCIHTIESRSAYVHA
jgi:hypothetical protein